MKFLLGLSTFILITLSCFLGNMNQSIAIEASIKPSLPLVVGSISFGPSSNTIIAGVAVNGSYLYMSNNQPDGQSIGNYHGELRVFDISNPSAPKEIANINTGNIYGKLLIQGNYLYLAGNPETLHMYSDGTYYSIETSFLYVYDLSNPRTPLFLSSLDLSLQMSIIQDFTISENYAYISGNKTLAVVDISHKDNPALIGLMQNIRQKAVVAYGSTVVTRGRDKANIFNVSDPSSPRMVSESNKLSLTPPALALFKKYLYISSGHEIQIYDISNNSFKKVNSYSLPITPTAFNISGDYFYASDYKNGLIILDISNPESPVRLSISGALFSGGSQLFSSGSYVYAFTSSDVRIVKVKNTSSDESNDNSSSLPLVASDMKLTGRLKGKILIQVQDKGEAWYVHPTELKRYYLGRPKDALKVMRSKSAGITNANLAKIPTNADTFKGDMKLRQRMAGRILLQVENGGAAWYVNPKNLKRYSLGRISDFADTVKKIGTGITNANLAKIPSLSSGNPGGISYVHKSVKTAGGIFAIDMIVADISNPRVKILADTASSIDCEDNCPVKPLKSYIDVNSALAGINGTVFCPKDYSECLNKDGSFQTWDIYNSRLEKFIRPIGTNPFLVFDNRGNWFLYKNANEFPGIKSFEYSYNSKIQSAISGYFYATTVEGASIRTVKPNIRTSRGSIGLREKKAYLIIAHKANLGDMNAIMNAMNMKHAIGVDGGGSSAMYYNGAYKVGPGRNIPNAIVVAER